MSKKWLTIMLLSGVMVLAACSEGHKSANEFAKSDTPSSHTDTGSYRTANPRADDTVVHKRKSGTINIRFSAGDSIAEVAGRLEDIDTHDTVSIRVENARQLNAMLMPAEALSNIRINQVIYPDGKMDGPYGQELSIATQSNGTYRLIIAQNLMAEGQPIAAYRLRVRLVLRGVPHS